MLALHKIKVLKNLAAIACICSYTLQRTFGLNPNNTLFRYGRIRRCIAGRFSVSTGRFPVFIRRFGVSIGRVSALHGITRTGTFDHSPLLFHFLLIDHHLDLLFLSLVSLFALELLGQNLLHLRQRFSLLVQFPE